MRQVVQLLGQPEDHLLRQGIHTRKYFLEEEGPDGPAWRLKVKISSLMSHLLHILFKKKKSEINN